MFITRIVIAIVMNGYLSLYENVLLSHLPHLLAALYVKMSYGISGLGFRFRLFLLRRSYFVFSSSDGSRGYLKAISYEDMHYY